jgi:hypothetical protein
MASKRILISLSDLKRDALKEIMTEDLSENVSGYIGDLIVAEKKRRDQKKPVGRPRTYKESDTTIYYPPPYEGGGVYTKEELVSYYEFRNLPVPPLPKPLTEEELKKHL